MELLSGINRLAVGQQRWRLVTPDSCSTSHGGQRYTSKKKLVLERRQKTHRKFYLFVLYDVVIGRVHWALLPGKDSVQVCAFMKRVHWWYPEKQVWVVLDQDPAHPRKSKQTRRLMRQLRLRWMSLPKASPDDNPVETIFSDIQGSILDGSHDHEPKQTERRISAHLRGRNRRRDRFIRVHYLGHSHKGRCQIPTMIMERDG